jgi:hypothetical protein
MNKPRNGKIARLPREVREELNRRLQDGEQGASLAAWLNALPAVQAVVAAEFDGKPVREQNLSEWRKGGYRDWLGQQEAMDALRRLNADVVESREHTGELTDNVGLWLMMRYLAAARAKEGEDGQLEWKTLREFCADFVALRRGDHSAARLVIESKRQVAQETFAKDRWKRSLIKGLEALKVYVEKHPKAKAAFDALAEQVSTPFDDMEAAP